MGRKLENLVDRALEKDLRDKLHLEYAKKGIIIDIKSELKHELADEYVEEAEKELKKRSEKRKYDEIKNLTIVGIIIAFFVGLEVNQVTYFIELFSKIYFIRIIVMLVLFVVILLVVIKILFKSLKGYEEADK